MQNSPPDTAQHVPTPDAPPEPPPPPPPIPPAPVGYTSGSYIPAIPAWHTATGQTSGQAIAALVFAAIGLVGGWSVLLLVASLVGIVLGHLALGAIGRAGGYLRGRGLAIAALVCGYGAIVVWLAVWFV